MIIAERQTKRTRRRTHSRGADAQHNPAFGGAKADYATLIRAARWLSMMTQTSPGRRDDGRELEVGPASGHSPRCTGLALLIAREAAITSTGKLFALQAVAIFVACGVSQAAAEDCG
jgi:hypothetical protein